jgi:enterochelin esterase-like enzyme
MKLAFRAAAMLCVCCLLAPLSVLGQPQENPNPAVQGGELVAAMVPAPSLQGNAFSIPVEQPVSIYLPPSYQTSGERYPVVYFLPGFGDFVHYYTLWGVYGFSLKSSMDQLIATGKTGEMIVVIPNGSNFLQGSFYVNSALMGNWEDYITKDVVSYVDQRYRTIASPSSRGISGHSMGGFGALQIAMHHPDLFGAVYALSPGLAVPEGLKQHDMFADSVMIRSVLTLMDTLAQLPDDKAKVVLMSSVNSMLNAANQLEVFAIAYGIAFAPRRDGRPPFFEYPCSITNGKIEFDSRIWARWEKGFGDLASKVKANASNLKKLNAIVVDVGTHDEHAWIPPGCRSFAALLKDNGISCQLTEFEGGHQDQLKQRLEEHLLPEMSRVLKRTEN